MKRCAMGLGALAVIMSAPSRALAHGVFGDSNPSDRVYVMPGMVFNSGAAIGRDVGLFDGGLEVSAHRFLPAHGSAFSQLGYGALVQLELAGTLTEPHTKDDPGFRAAIGIQGTYGLLGAQMGPMLRTPQGPFAGTVGAFVGVFASIGIISTGPQLDLPVVGFGSSERLPPLFLWMVTLKYPLSFKD